MEYFKNVKNYWFKSMVIAFAVVIGFSLDVTDNT